MGFARRKRFDESLHLLRALGLSRSAIEHDRRLAGNKRRLPHELVRALIEHAAERDAPSAIIGGGSSPA
jgi:hypothetical protein